MAKILLVEDDNNLREIYEARLQAEGYTIISASDGEEALVLAKNEKPDLIISDVMMPKISGFEMLDILRNTEGLKQVRVIMLTALGQSDDQQRATRLGADHYLVKSQVTLEDIVTVAHELLEDQSGETQPPVGTTEPPAPPPAPPIPPAAPLPPTPPPPVAPVPPPLPPEPPAAPPAPPTTGAPPTVSSPSSTLPAGLAPAVSTSEPVLTAPAVSAPVATPAPVIPEPIVAAPAPTVAAVSEVNAYPPIIDSLTPAAPPAPPTTGAPPTVSSPSSTLPAGLAPAVSTSEPVLTAPAVSAPVATPAPVIPEPIVAAPAPTVAAVSEGEEETATTAPPLNDEPVTAIDTPESPMINVTEEAKEEESVAQTTAQEEASVEAKIEDFVKGATTTAPSPDPPPNEISDVSTTSNEISDNLNQANALNIPVAPGASLAVSSETAAKTATDDKIMAHAMNSLITETTAPYAVAPPSEVLPSAPVIQKVTSSVEKQHVPTSDEPTSTPLDPVSRVILPSNTDAAKNDAVTIAHKKIISPVDAPPKHDLKTLLSLEAAKEAAAEGEPVPQVVTDTPADQLPAASPPSSIDTVMNTPDTTSSSAQQFPENPSLDPNSIAL